MTAFGYKYSQCHITSSVITVLGKKVSDSSGTIWVSLHL